MVDGGQVGGRTQGDNGSWCLDEEHTPCKFTTSLCSSEPGVIS